MTATDVRKIKRALIRPWTVTSKRCVCLANDDDDDEITPSARVKMLRHMQEDLERKRVQEDEDRKRSELARQAAEERERQERYE